MLWHFFGLQGSGKSVGIVIWSQDFHIKKGYKVYANFWLKFGSLISIKDLMDFKYDNCVIILDEAYGVADSHQMSKANDSLTEVIHQSRKKHVEVFFATQLDTDLYKRIRISAHRRILCQNIGTELKPVLAYRITDQYDNIIKRIIFKTDAVKGTYPLFNTEETIMPMHLNPEMKFSKVLELFNEVTNRKSFEVLMKEENKFFIKDVCDTAYDLIKQNKNDRAMKLLKMKE